MMLHVDLPVVVLIAPMEFRLGHPPLALSPGESLAVDVRFQPTEEKFYNVNEPRSKDSAQ